ncbi:MAG: DNA methylase [Lachnospiraceae bacterium]|nr:DNA methylase [Lachnospiraceae bacterium]
MSQDRIYCAIDLKSFYASVECTQRDLDPLSTNLVVADISRTEKTICLAVSPSLKSYGLAGRSRLFEVVQRVKEINADRLRNAPGHRFTGESYDIKALERDPSLKLSYIAAPPQMAEYMAVSTEIFSIYLKYVSPEDIHVYSIDEVFMDFSAYLHTYKMSAQDLTKQMIHDILSTTGITATAGIGTNLYLCKIAMDIVAKHVPADENGVRIAQLDEMSYRDKLWNHRPLTDFWRLGRGYARKLEENGIFTMGDVARCSLGSSNDFYNEDFLYRLFGINAELLIDHAWGWEPVTIKDIKSYKPENNSLGSGQVLQCPYTYDKAKLIIHEMTDLLILDLVDKDLETDQMVLTIGYDITSLTDPEIRRKYKGPVTIDHYGRAVPKHAHGSANIGHFSSSSREIIQAVLELYDKIADPDLLIRRVSITASHILPTKDAEARNKQATQFEQLDLFTDYRAAEKKKIAENAEKEKERNIQKAIISIKKKYGKNALLKGMNLEEGGTTIMRNNQIGGHKA